MDKIIETFITEKTNGEFEVMNPFNYREIIGTYRTKVEAENSLKEFIVFNQIIFE
jgi:hypothetical protein